VLPPRWLARVRHDLVKRLVWPARDRRDAGGAPAPGELVAQLVDDEGRPAPATAIWSALATEAPPTTPQGVLDDFGRALAHAEAAARAGDVEGVLALETAFDALARGLEHGSQGGS